MGSTGKGGSARTGRGFYANCWCRRLPDSPCNQGPLAEFYRRKVKGIGHRRAVIALARKLLIAAWRLMQTDRLAYELEDEKARRGYERTLREIKCDIAKDDERPGTGRYPVQSQLGTTRNGDVDDSMVETPEVLEDASQQDLSRKGVSRAQVPA